MVRESFLGSQPSVAQMVEQRLCRSQVVGSNPTQGSKLYLVRGYMPAYCSGFTIRTARGVSYEEIVNTLRWGDPQHEGVSHYEIEPYYGDELIVSECFTNGKHYVIGFALPEDSKEMAPDGGLLRENWRYRDHES